MKVKRIHERGLCNLLKFYSALGGMEMIEERPKKNEPEKRSR